MSRLLVGLLMACMVGGAHMVGAPMPVTELNEKQKGIVEFAKTELVREKGVGGKESSIRMENFTSQVVAGIMYQFDLVYDGEEQGKEQVCKMAVWEKSWENYKEVQWDRVKCVTRDAV